MQWGVGENHKPAKIGPVSETEWCFGPEDLIDPVKVNDIGLGKSIYTKEQLDEFARFKDSQGTRKAYLAETAVLAYTGRSEESGA